VTHCQDIIIIITITILKVQIEVVSSQQLQEHFTKFVLKK